MNISVKKANIKHLDFISRSQVSMALETEEYELDLSTVEKGVKAVLEKSNLGTYYVGLYNDKPVSCLFTTYEWSDWRNKGVLWIQSVYVAKEFRNNGIYRKMYEHIQSIVHLDPNLSGIRLYVDKSNHNAIKVYEKLGMNTDHYHLCEWMP